MSNVSPGPMNEREAETGMESDFTYSESDVGTITETENDDDDYYPEETEEELITIEDDDCIYIEEVRRDFEAGIEHLDHLVPEISIISEDLPRREQENHSQAYLNEMSAEVIQEGEALRFHEQMNLINTTETEGPLEENVPPEYLYMLNPEDYPDDPTKQKKIQRAIYFHNYRRRKREYVATLLEDNKMLREGLINISEKAEMSRNQGPVNEILTIQIPPPLPPFKEFQSGRKSEPIIASQPLPTPSTSTAAATYSLPLKEPLQPEPVSTVDSCLPDAPLDLSMPKIPNEEKENNSIEICEARVLEPEPKPASSFPDKTVVAQSYAINEKGKLQLHEGHSPATPRPISNYFSTYLSAGKRRYYFLPEHYNHPYVIPKTQRIGANQIGNQTLTSTVAQEKSESRSGFPGQANMRTEDGPEKKKRALNDSVRRALGLLNTRSQLQLEPSSSGTASCQKMRKHNCSAKAKGKTETMGMDIGTKSELDQLEIPDDNE